MKLLIFVSVLCIVNLSYAVTRIYQLGLLNIINSTAPELIILLINSIIMPIFAFFYINKKQKVNKIDATNSVQKPAVDVNKSTSFYTDLLLIEHFPNLLCIKDLNGKWIQASPKYLFYLNMQNIDYMGKTDAYLVDNSKNNQTIFLKNIAQDKKAWELRKSVKSNMLFTLNDGYDIQLEIITTPIYDDANNPFRLLVTGKQIELTQKTKKMNWRYSQIFFLQVI